MLKINRMHFTKINFGKKNVLSRTGYTGEDGYEIFLPVEIVEKFARSLSSSNLKNNSWIGLAARDFLGSKQGIPLHGHEILRRHISSRSKINVGCIHSIKAVSSGKEFLEKQKISGDYGKVFHYEVRIEEFLARC